MEGGVMGEQDLESGLRLAAATARTVDAVERGRKAASMLRDEARDTTGELIDELCDSVQAARRQVVRLGFDLHDEGLQDVVALRNDLTLFRRQLIDVLADSQDRQRIVGRVDDFLARVHRLDDVLREVVGAASVRDRMGQSLTRTLAEIVEASAGVEVESTFDPDLDTCGLTVTQRVAVVRVVQNALGNVVQHSGASSAVVDVRCAESAVEVEVTDDGNGFDVEEAWQRAERDHRFGLASMRERVHLLGGDFSLTSRPGGPTRVFVRLALPE
jgi:signal transduction histidine kinase